MIDIERLTIATETMAELIESADLDAMLPPVLRTAAGLLKRFGRIDLTGEVRSMVLAWLRALPASAASSPSQSTAALTWANHLLAWLAGERDDPPGDLDLTGAPPAPPA
jgi:hypothetical protein